MKEISEIQIWRIIQEVQANNKEEAEEKALLSDGEVITEKCMDIEYTEVVDVEEIK